MWQVTYNFHITNILEDINMEEIKIFYHVIAFSYFVVT